MKNLWLIPLSVGLLFLGCTKLVPKESPSAEHFSKGFKAYQAGDFETAALYLKPLVEDDYPGAQLLMARMYANGQGVPENMELSEDLRNKAALRLYSQLKPTPGQVDPHSENLSMVEKRVNYYVNGLENGDSEAQDTSASTPLPATALPINASNASGATPSPVVQTYEKSDDFLQRMTELSNELRHEQILSVSRISLSNLLVEASSGKKEAARQIAEAYKKGLYGIKPDPVEAAIWEKK